MAREVTAVGAGRVERRWLLGLALGAVAVATTLEPGLSNDAWWHLALGRWTVEEGTIPLVDPFPTLREGTFWVRSGWLADVAMYTLYGEGGQSAVRLATSGIVAITTLGLWLRSRGPLVVRVVVVGTAVLALNGAAVPRPLVLALPLLLLTEAVLARERSSPTRWLWGLPVVAALWANVHGTFVLVPGLLALDTVVMVAMSVRTGLRRARRLGIVLVLTIVATLLNPFGWRLLAYPLEVGRLTALGLIEEWQPTLAVFPQSLLYVVISAGAAWVVWARRDRLGLAELARLALFLVAGALAVRHVALLAVVAAPIVSRALATRRDGTRSTESGASATARRDRSAVDAVFDAGVLVATAGTALAIAVTTSADAAVDRATAATFPVEAAAAVEEVAPVGARIYHPYGWGGYLLWRWDGGYGTFVDGRTELFGDELVLVSLAIADARGDWAGVLDRQEVDYVLTATGGPLDTALSASVAALHRDDVAVVYRWTKRNP